MRLSYIFTTLFAAAGLVAACGEEAEKPAATPTPTCSPGNFVDYVVVAGDTLTKIADHLHSGICNITYINNLTSPDVILVGQHLKVPTYICDPDNTSCLTPPGTADCVPNRSSWTIQPGDTFFTIARRLGLKVEALRAANEGVDPLDLQPGQVIKVPICPSTVTPTPTPTPPPPPGGSAFRP